MRFSSRVISAVLLLLVISYGLVKAVPLIRGPHIVISELSTNEHGLTVLSGTAVHTEKLSLDGGTLLIDGDGRFSTTLMLPRGGAILKLTATDRFGRSTSLERDVVTP
jgi:hypothetical protein